MANLETGRYFVNEAAHLLAALRLWAQSQYRSDEIVREILETVSLVTLGAVAAQLQALGDADAMTASWTIHEMVRLPSEQLQAIATYALRAL